MDIGAMYGLVVALVIGLAWLSGDHVIQKVALLLLLAWASTNLVVNYFGFARAATINPSIDAAIAVTVAYVGCKPLSRLALVVFVMYAVVGAVWVIAWANHAQEARVTYDVLGVLFLGQLSAVGGTGGGLALRHWATSRHSRLRPYPARR